MVSILFSNESNGYTVGKYKIVGKKADLISVIGYYLPDNKNVLIAEGEWTDNPKYGRQFVISSYEQELPSEEKAFVAFVAANIPHLGVKKAKKLFKKFGSSIWDEAERNENIFEDTGIHDKRLKKTALRDLVEQAREVSALTAFLKGEITLSQRQLANAAKQFGVEQIKNNPYLLMQENVSFMEIDCFAIKRGQPAGAYQRIRGAVLTILTAAQQAGHTFVFPHMLLYGDGKRGLRYGVKTLLDMNAEVSETVIRKALAKMEQDRLIVFNACGYYLYDSIREETMIAKLLTPYQEADCEDESMISSCIQEFECDEEIKLSSSQIEAIKKVFCNRISVITGCPGTGKTTLVKALLKIAAHLDYNRPCLVAPTGKAARKLAASTGCEASTILSKIGWTGENDFQILAGGGLSIEADLIVVDETSMVDQKTMAMLLASITGTPRLVLIGDPNQLPSVGAGNVLSDIIYSKTIPTTELNVIFRQKGEENPIVVNAQKMLHGDLNMMENKNFRFFDANDEDSFQICTDLYKKEVKKAGADNVALMVPYRKKIDTSRPHYTCLTADEFNESLQESLNPKTAGKAEYSMGKRVFRVGDRVMQQKNTESAKNGDTGVITAIYPKTDESPERIQILFNGTTALEYDHEQMQDVSLAYASTVHKMQGSEVDSVILCLSGRHGALLARNLVYTAITRAKKRVYIVGARKAFDYAVMNDTSKDMSRQRLTLLCPRLKYYNKRRG